MPSSPKRLWFGLSLQVWTFIAFYEVLALALLVSAFSGTDPSLKVSGVSLAIGGPILVVGRDYANRKLAESKRKGKEWREQQARKR